MTRESPTSPRSWTGRRPALACLAAFLLAVPFTGLMVLVLTRWEPLRALDDDTTHALHRYVLGHRGLVRPLQAISSIFHPWVFRVVIACLAGLLFARGARRLALWAMATLVAGGVLTLLLKVLVGRVRPTLTSPIAHASGGAFPSGHALTAALGCAVLVLILLPALSGTWRAVAWTAAALITLATGFSRVALGVHYLSDVVAGWVLGVAIVIATVAAFEIWRREHGRPAVAPAAEGAEPEAVPEIAPPGRPEHGPGRG
ncbi:MAG TPA: phosphatase PAP2 family protein [Actinomadura sp.]|jgi:undecaprenyl-diphosphatase|nr:phosphatase PAP2 family protein [Actinomadura sp.]